MGIQKDNEYRKLEENFQKYMQTKLAEDLIPGGKGDDRPDSDFKACKLEIGTAVELGEHTNDPEKAKEIAKDHLTENPEYYKELFAAGLVDEPKAIALYKKHAQACAVTNEVQTESKVGDFFIEIQEATDESLIALAKLNKLYSQYDFEGNTEPMKLLNESIMNIQSLQGYFDKYE